MKKKPLLIITALAAVALGTAVVMSEYGRKPEQAAAMEEVATVSATDLLKAFVTDEQAATNTYVGKAEQAIVVQGVVRAVEPGDAGKVNVVLATDDAMAGIICEFAKADVPAAWKAGDTVRIKGICTGYLIDVILNRCAPVE